MKGYSATRTAIYRRYKRLLAATNLLADHEVLPRRDRKAIEKRVEELYSYLKEERKRNAPPARPPGRPRLQLDRGEVFKECKREDCSKPPAKGQAYCSRACAPCGYYDLPSPKAPAWK